MADWDPELLDLLLGPEDRHAREFVTPWGRAVEMDVREVEELQRRVRRGGPVVIGRAQAWVFVRTLFLWRPWCAEREDAERVASAYATVVTAFAVQADKRRSELT